MTSMDGCMHGTAADYTFFDDDVLDAFLLENDEVDSEASASRNDEQSKHPSETSSRHQASVNLSVWPM
jgi:sensor domain CHASE-containing protein